ncbi:MAG TPA: acyl-CoA dehydrogenase family protein [Steroidobacteraceae bacterium]|nr:acyl-CoA dehydrogenase family protein [Steroidobacteraceae bacterium]
MAGTVTAGSEAAAPSPWMDEELAIYRESVVRFVEAEMVPHDARWRAEHNVGHEIWRRAGALGLLCADIPAEYGGAGGDFRHEAVLYEELGRRGLSGFGQGVHSIAAHYLLNHGTEEQKRAYLPRLARGELVAAIAMTEPGAGSDLQGIRTRAVRAGGDYVVDGSKTFITNGYLAGLVLLVVKTDPAQGARGTSILIVETANLAGYRVGAFLDKIGQRAQDTNELFFEGVRVPAERLLGGVEGRGFAQLMGDLPYERIIVALQAVAAMEGALEATLRYVKERKAFGRPLIEFQNSRFRLAEAATIVRVARTFIDRCICDVVAGRLDDVGASMAKWWATDMQQRVLDECVQLHGGYGYMNEYLVARLYADARVTRIYGGTNEIMKELIARSF